nr:signal peptidase I [uncultured Mediterraneibacter sp.]
MSQQSSENKKNSFTKELIQWVIAIAAGILGALFISQVLIVNAEIPSGSMENTIMTGDRILGNRLAYLASDPERFDIIIFRYPDDESQLFIKRVIGLPGETVEIHDGNIYINGSEEPLDDVETKEPMTGSFGPYTVPENCYFVMGDNRNNSKDSRYWEHTFVTKDEILGKAFFKYWPINEMRGF